MVCRGSLGIVGHSLKYALLRSVSGRREVRALKRGVKGRRALQNGHGTHASKLYSGVPSLVAAHSIVAVSKLKIDAPSVILNEKPISNTYSATLNVQKVGRRQ